MLVSQVYIVILRDLLIRILAYSSRSGRKAHLLTHRNADAERGSTRNCFFFVIYSGGSRLHVLYAIFIAMHDMSICAHKQNANG